MSFLALKIVSSYCGRFWLSILCWIFIVPIVLYTFFHGVYNFGPRHHQWSFIDILWNPVPGIEFEGCITESNDFDLLKRRCFNHNLIARRIAQNARLTAKRTTQSSTTLVYDCPMAHMSPIAPKLHGYQTYALFYDTSIEHQVMDSERSMPRTLYFAICEFSCPEIVFFKLPWRPPNGFITSTLAMALIFSIFSSITICTCSRLSFMQLKQIKITHTILRETFHKTYLVLGELSQKVTLRYTFRQINLILTEYAQKMPQISTLKASCTRLLGFATLPSSILTQAFASEVIPFDTDSSFWVCDNLATGHICNDKSLFSGELVPLVYIVGTAMGKTELTLMGTVVLRTTDDNGEKHVFTLTHVNYVPQLPVNLLST
jgi:hypothetical protein